MAKQLYEILGITNDEWNRPEPLFIRFMRFTRGAYRRTFWPGYRPSRLSCVRLIMALRGCSLAEAKQRDNELAEAARVCWLEGF